jgi:hypothetical protein
MSEPHSEKEAKSNSAGGENKLPKLSRSKPPEPPPPHWATRLIKAPALLSFIWPMILVVGGLVVWQRWGAERIGQQFNRLDPASVVITPTPEYIRADVAAEVFRTHQLERTSLLSRMATAVVGEAFKTHPWVEEVLRVEKSTEGVAVQLRYRKPVASVRVKSLHPEIERDGLFFIDGNGVLLPTEDFGEQDIRRYLQILIPETYPAGIGAPYGDDRVMAAARIAKLLVDDRESLDLAAIELQNPRRTFDESWIFALVRSDGSRIVWGSPPGEEPEGEPSAESKLRMIRASGTGDSDLRMATLRRER